MTKRTSSQLHKDEILGEKDDLKSYFRIINSACDSKPQQIRCQDFEKSKFTVQSSAKLKELVGTFRYLDVTLSNLRIKKLSPLFSAVSENFEKLSGHPLVLMDIATILYVSHSIFNLHWEKIQGDYQMLISLPSSCSDDLGLSSVEERLRRFGKDVDEFINKFSMEYSWQQLVDVVRSSNQIPEKPENFQIDNKSKEPKAAKPKVLLLQELEKVRSSNAAKTVKASESHSIDDIKCQAIEREAQATLMVHQMQLANEKKEQFFLVKRLPAICNSLRTYCLTDKKYSVTSSSTVSRLSNDFRISKSEVRKSLSLLASVVPEYLTELPPDDVVPVATLRLNSSANHPSILKKVQYFVTTSVKETT